MPCSGPGRAWGVRLPRSLTARGQLDVQARGLAVHADPHALAALDGEVDHAVAHPHALDVEPAVEPRFQRVDPEPVLEHVDLHSGQDLQEVEERSGAPRLRAAADQVLAGTGAEA